MWCAAGWVTARGSGQAGDDVVEVSVVAVGQGPELVDCALVGLWWWVLVGCGVGDELPFRGRVVDRGEGSGDASDVIAVDPGDPWVWVLFGHSVAPVVWCPDPGWETCVSALGSRRCLTFGAWAPGRVGNRADRHYSHVAVMPAAGPMCRKLGELPTARS